MARLYAKTKSVKVVMKSSGHDFYTTKRKIVEGGGELLPRRRKSKLSKQRIVELYKNHSISQIAKRNGTSNTVVIHVLHAAGVVMRDRGGGEFHNRPIKHGHAGRAIELGMDPYRYVRLLTVVKLGGACSVCGERDLRVLDVNHINGEGVVRTAKRRCQKARYAEMLKVLRGETVPYLEVRCCNCNRRHEYDRGIISAIPKGFYGK